MHLATLVMLAEVLDMRDGGTSNHSRCVGRMCEEMAIRLGLDDESVDRIRVAGVLHDIGKVGIPDAILLKPGALDRDEFEIMKLHAEYGGNTIGLVEQHLGGSNSFLMYARQIARWHQEKWDGSGYPDNLVGDQIPLAARLMAVADVYDALISRRVYKPPFSHQEALAIMKKGRGSHFDPDIIDAFFEIEGRFAEIAREFSDEESRLEEGARAA
jgi:putative two-component system response regulator